MSREVIILDPEYINIISSSRYMGPFKTETREQAEVPLRIKRHMRTEEFFNKMAASNTINGTSILPHNCRLAKNNGNGYTTYVIEEEPRIRSIMVDFSLHRDMEELKRSGLYEKYGIKEILDNSKSLDTKSRGGIRLNVAFPYMIFFIELNRDNHSNSMKAFYRIHELGGLGDQLFYTNLSNANRDQRLCLGSNISSSRTVRNPTDGCNEVLERFWNNGFNNDYIYNVERYKTANTPYVSNYLEWAAMTAQDPLFIYDVPWIKFPGTIKSLLGDSTSNNNISYGRLKSIFTVADNTEVKENVGRVKIKLIDNVTDQFYMGDNINLEIGEEIVIGDKRYITESFVGDEDYTVKYIRAQDEEGKIVDLAANSTNMSAIKKHIQDSRVVNAIEVNGVEVKVGETVKYETPGYTGSISVGKILKLRLRRQGIVEAIIGSTSFILNNFPVKPIDLSKIIVNDVQVTKGMQFYYRSENSNGRKRMIDIYYIAEYDSLTTRAGAANIVFRYKTTDDGSSSTLKFPLSSSITMDDDDLKVTTDILTSMESIDASKAVPLPFYHHFHKIVMPTEKNPHYRMDGINGLVKFAGDSSYSNIYNSSTVVSKLINESGTELYIPGLIYDNHLITGDQVVVADWQTHTEMLRIKTISGFVFNEDLQRIDVIVYNNDEPEKLINIPYVNVLTGIALIGKIRKIDTEYPGLSAGYKTRCNTAYITAFPKKDINEIVGVLETVGDDPLVLFSNYTTLPLSFVQSDFTIYTPKSTYYKKLETYVMETPQKYKYQTGDLCVMPGSSDNIFNTLLYTAVTNKDGYGNHRKYLASIHKHEIMEEYDKTSLRSCRRFGFLSPRLSAQQQVDVTGKRYFPDLYGGIIEDESSYLCL